MTSGEAYVTSGGRDGMSGVLRDWSPRQIRWTAFCVFVLVTTAQAIANAYSRHADLAGTNRSVALWQTGIEEASSGVAWVLCLVAIWHLATIIRPPRFGWPATLALHLLATVPVSLLHVGLMVALRALAFPLAGSHYDFAGDLPGALLYEYRKDAVSYVLLVGFSAGVQLVTRQRPDLETVNTEAARFLAISDGAATHLVPLDEIDWVEASGNYVTLHTARREYLHRITLAALANTLAPKGFTRIHRSRLVRNGAIRQVETLQSGDFTMTLNNGNELRGSRRYRAGVIEMPLSVA